MHNEKMKLKPCPFCGGEEIRAEISYITKQFTIYCASCPTEMGLYFADADLGNGDIIDFDEMQQWIHYMVERWNIRKDSNND